MCKRLNKEDFSSLPAWGEYIGTYAESRFIEECAKRNILCLKAPLLSRYDFVIEIDKMFYKVQVKGSSLLKGRKVHAARASSYDAKTNSRVRYKKEDVDYFAYYLVENDEMYLVPSNVILKRDRDVVAVFDKTLYKGRSTQSAINISKYREW